MGALRVAALTPILLFILLLFGVSPLYGESNV